ncbi:MAG: YraN family protein [Pirellula sp.]
MRNSPLASVTARISRIKLEIQNRWVQWRLSRPYPRRLPTESVGQYGERLAAIFLERKGYFILERSFRIRSGEIDIIAVWQKRVVVFVEVKTWAMVLDNSGGPSDAVDDAKQEKITKTAMTYMKRHRMLECAGRADVLQIVLGTKPTAPEFRHFENAFESVGNFQLFT